MRVGTYVVLRYVRDSRFVRKQYNYTPQPHLVGKKIQVVMIDGENVRIRALGSDMDVYNVKRRQLDNFQNR